MGAATEALTSGWWTMGPRVERLEQAFAEFSGSRHAVATANGTAALHLALLACDCGPEDEVVLPSLNFVAAANVIGHTGATPVFCDVRGSDDLNLDPQDLEEAVSPRTKAILVLHYGGHPCDMDAVGAIADRHGLAVVEDAAHAPGATWRGRRCGTLGRLGCFSFFSNKNLPIGEGGMIVTDDDAVARRLRLLRSHGMTKLTWDRHRGHAHTYDVLIDGFNYRMDEIRAAMGLVQLHRLEDANQARARIVARYRSALEEIEDLAMPFGGEPEWARPAHHLAVIVLPPHVSREGVQAAFLEARIQTSVHYPPIHRFSQYRGARRGDRLNVTDALADRLLTLPLYPHMKDGQVDAVVETLRRALGAPGGARGSRAHAALPRRPVRPS